MSTFLNTVGGFFSRSGEAFAIVTQERNLLNDLNEALVANITEDESLVVRVGGGSFNGLDAQCRERQ